MIQLNQEYTYVKICEELEWQVYSGGNSKKAQIKAIEEAYEFYHPINPKTHKPKKSYIFTKQLKELNKETKPKRTKFPDEEFTYLLYAMFKESIRKNEYWQRGMCGIVYVNNTVIYESFGLNPYLACNKENLPIVEGDTLVIDVFQNIVLEIVKSMTISRICRVFKFPKNSMPKGILRFEGIRSLAAKRKIPDDSLLEEYNKREKEIMQEYGFKSIIEAVKKEKYLVIQERVQTSFEAEKKMGVKRVNKIDIPGEMFIEINKYDINQDIVLEYQKHFCKIVVESVSQSVEKRINQDDKYKLKLSTGKKEMLKTYLNTFAKYVLGNDVEINIDKQNIDNENDDDSSMDELLKLVDAFCK